MSEEMAVALTGWELGFFFSFLMYVLKWYQDSAKGGTIVRIRLENFMCHEHFEIELVSGINYIAGENGSGKSAILTALIVCLGTKARETKRAKKLTDFINKRGAS